MVQFFYQSSESVAKVTNGPTWASHDFGKFKAFAVSKNGLYVGLLSEEGIQILDAKSNEKVSFVAGKNFVGFEFSPLGSFVSAHARYSVKDPSQVPKNHSIYDTKSGSFLTSFASKTFNIQWQSNDLFYIRQTTELLFYNKSELIQKLPIEATSYSIQNTFLAVFLKEKNNVPATIKIFDVSSTPALVSTRTIFNADSVEFLWNNNGSFFLPLATAILIQTRTEVDKTNKSYYGKSVTYLFKLSEKYENSIVELSNPIHSLCWAPNSLEFIALHGSVPPKATMFDASGKWIYDFPALPRNTVKYSPHGRFIAMAGFGNITNGCIDIWDRLTFQKLSTINAPNTSELTWSPDGRHLMTSILYRRLKVDNGARVWHYSGVCVYQVLCKELVACEWGYDDCSAWPLKRSLSPPPVGITLDPKVNVAPVGVYRPPGARGRFEIPGKSKPSTPAKESVIVPAAAPPPPPAYIPSEAEQKVLALEKKIKGVQKKLKQISEVKRKQESGVPLELNQVEKIRGEAGLVSELEQLTRALADFSIN